jgi:hypothetical protein
VCVCYLFSLSLQGEPELVAAPPQPSKADRAAQRTAQQRAALQQKRAQSTSPSPLLFSPNMSRSPLLPPPTPTPALAGATPPRAPVAAARATSAAPTAAWARPSSASSVAGVGPDDAAAAAERSEFVSPRVAAQENLRKLYVRAHRRRLKTKHRFSFFLSASVFARGL